MKALNAAESMADHDPLLPLFNRRAFVRELSRLTSFSKRYGMEASLVYFDLDGFKSINDTYGHSAGDKILTAVSDVLINQTRESDVIGRLGGDEFAVVLTGIPHDTARVKSSQLAQAIGQIEVEHDGQKLTIETSFGISNLDQNETAEIQLARADEAMYSAKLRRKAQV
jgi:diguanylate cyclase (GGDEF)-like protein